MKNFLKTTIATYDPHGDEPEISYAPVDIQTFRPSYKRLYGS